MNALDCIDRYLGEVDSLRAFTTADNDRFNDGGDKSLSIGTTNNTN